MIEALKKYKFIYDLLIIIYCLPRTLYFYFSLLFFGLFKIDNKKIIFVSFNGKGYGDNGKYICNELLGYNYDIYWATKEEYKDSLPKKVKYVKYNSIEYLYHLATAKIWVNNSRFGWGIRKRKDQFYIQTWHGGIGFKKIDAAAEKNLSTYYILSAKNDSKLVDLLISNSTFCTNVYKNDFRYYGDNILECGSPRNDILIKNMVPIEKMRDFFGLSNYDKVCLYAPTFRENNSLNAYNISCNLLLNALEKKYKCDWKLLIRLHPHVSHLAKQLFGFNENIINVTDYPDMQELLVFVDFLITDYSSCVFDYALLKRPVILYVSDINEFNGKERNFIIKPENTPFPIASNSKELVHEIINFDDKGYSDAVDNFYNVMGLNETGESSKKIVNIINKIVKGDNNL